MGKLNHSISTLIMVIERRVIGQFCLKFYQDFKYLIRFYILVEIKNVIFLPHVKLPKKIYHVTKNFFFQKWHFLQISKLFSSLSYMQHERFYYTLCRSASLAKKELTTLSSNYTQRRKFGTALVHILEKRIPSVLKKFNS